MLEAEADPTTAVSQLNSVTFKKVRQLLKLYTSLIQSQFPIADHPNYACEKGVEKDWLYNKYIRSASPSDKKGRNRTFWPALIWRG
jgi:hypothetical protein